MSIYCIILFLGSSSLVQFMGHGCTVMSGSIVGCVAVHSIELFLKPQSWRHTGYVCSTVCKNKLITGCTAILQVFEWCNYILYSSKYCKSPHSTVITSGRAMEGVLEPSYFSCLQEYYKTSVTENSNIVVEYQRAFVRATNARSKSQFPSRSVWNPPGRELSSMERLQTIKSS